MYNRKCTIFPFALTSNVHNQRQPILLIYCDIYLTCRYSYELLLCSGQYIESQARHHVQNLSKRLDNQLLSSSKKEKKNCYG